MPIQVLSPVPGATPTQLPGGSFSHESQTAWDFGVVKGTAVHAVAGGTVVGVYETEYRRSSANDNPPYTLYNAETGVVVGTTQDKYFTGNFVVIKHGANTSDTSDDFYSLYLHLRHQGAEVVVGQEVIAGQLIAYSGGTGRATAEHLHFEVSKSVHPTGYGSNGSVYLNGVFNLGDNIVEFVSGGGNSNNPPSAQGYSQSVEAGSTVALSTLFSFNDNDPGDSVVQFKVRDRDVGGGYLTKNGVAQTENLVFTANVSEINQWAFVAGPAGSSGVIGFQAIDANGPLTSASATATVTGTALQTGVTVSISDAGTVDEGGNLVFNLTRSGDASEAITLGYNVTSSSTAQSGSDYLQPSGSVTFIAGSRDAQIIVNTINDGADDALDYETVNIQIFPWNVGLNPGSATGTIRDTFVANTNTAPIAVNDTYSTNQGQSLTISFADLLSNDRDPEFDNFYTYSFTQSTLNGTISVGLSGSFLYVPNAGYVGSDSFTYSVFDGQLESNFATVFINVVGNPTAPEIMVKGNNIEIVDGDTTPSTTDGTSFGSVVQGGAAITKSFTVTNTGTAPLSTSGLTMPAGFSLVGASLPASININSSVMFTVRLDTTTAGPKFGEIRFNTNDASEPIYNFNISGTVTAPQPTAPEIRAYGNTVEIFDNYTSPRTADSTDFGSVVQGGSIIKTFAIKNDGNANLIINGITLPSGFNIVGAPADSTIPAGMTYFYDVQINTTTPGVKSGDIIFTTNDANESTFNFTITGTVTVPPTSPEITVSFGAINIADNTAIFSEITGTDFGHVNFGGAGATRTYTVTNTGNAILTTSGITGLPAGYTVVEGLSSSILQGASDTFTIRMDASVLGVKNGMISFTTNDVSEAAYNFFVAGEVQALPTLITGTKKANVLIGTQGVDTINALAGNDTIRGNGGDDIIDGGKGTDTAIYAGLSTTYDTYFDEDTGQFFVDGVDGEDMLINVEKFQFSDGTLSANQVKGGFDTIKGTAKANTLNGSIGTDLVLGLSGNDTLYGNGSDDAINGGKGNDTMSGGAGEDWFVFTDVKFGSDVITDFVDGSEILWFKLNVADSFSDFTITGNGSTAVTVAIGNSQVIVQSTSNITIGAEDFLFG